MAQRRNQDIERDARARDPQDDSDFPARDSVRDVTDDEIAIRAYELYEQRGGEHGRDWDDWLEAENELRARGRSPGPTPS
jgi:hypothetical protein